MALDKDVVIAFVLSISAGLSTCIGGIIVFCKRFPQLASPVTLAISLSLSAGVMIFISLVEIFGKSVQSFKNGFGQQLLLNEATLFNDTTTLGKRCMDFLNKTNDGKYRCLSCDTVCEGHAWLVATATFVLGVLLIFIIDYTVGWISPVVNEDLEVELDNRLPRRTLESGSVSGDKFEQRDQVNQPKEDAIFSRLSKRELNRTGLLTSLAIGLHNIPEGVATYVAAIGNLRMGAVFAVGIALHNIPEGIAVATPVYLATGSRLKAFMWTLVSALAEPLGAFMALLILGDGLDAYVEGAMFGVVCGMMVTISFKELIPTAIKYHSRGNCGTLSILCGMAIMALSLIMFAYAGV